MNTPEESPRSRATAPGAEEKPAADKTASLSGRSVASDPPRVHSPVETPPVPKVAGYEIHPLALAFPRMTDEEVKALADDINKNGLLRPVIIHKGAILDGVNRAFACVNAGVKLRTELLADGVDPVAFVVAQNIRRRHLSATQRAVIAAKLMPYFQAEAAQRKRLLSGTRSNPDGSTPEVTENLPEPEEQGEAREKAAAAAGANPKYVSDLLRLRRTAPELFEDVEVGRLNIPKALKKLEDKEEHSPDKTSGTTTREEFIAVLWDDSIPGDAKSRRAPEKTYNSRVYPNIAFFQLHAAGVCEFGHGHRQGMTQAALFAVRGKLAQPIVDRNGTRLSKATCQFLTLSVRGMVPEPEVLPDQIINNGYDGVIRMIDGMWPAALKVVSTTRTQAPPGWELITRQPASKTSSSAAEEPPAKELSVADAALQGVTELKKKKRTKGSKAKPPQPASTPEDEEGPPNNRKKKADGSTAKEVLEKVCDYLSGIGDEVQDWADNMPDNLQASAKHDDAEQAGSEIEQLSERLSDVMSGMDENAEVEEYEELPSQVRLRPPRFIRGSRPKQVGRLIEVIDAVAEAIKDRAADVAEELRDVADELSNVSWP
jgi:ParB-like chromosome segregation protein Spo0J/gas vesicle protein